MLILWKTIWRFHKKLKIELPHDPEIPLLGIFLKNNNNNKSSNLEKKIPCSWIGKTNIFKMTISSKAIYRFNAISIKLPMAIFLDLEQQQQQQNSKFLWKYRIPQVAKSILIKKNRVGGIRLLDIRLYYKATIIKTEQYWYKNRNINGTE